MTTKTIIEKYHNGDPNVVQQELDKKEIELLTKQILTIIDEYGVEYWTLKRNIFYSSICRISTSFVSNKSDYYINLKKPISGTKLSYNGSSIIESIIIPIVYVGVSGIIRKNESIQIFHCSSTSKYRINATHVDWVYPYILITEFEKGYRKRIEKILKNPQLITQEIRNHKIDSLVD